MAQAPRSFLVTVYEPPAAVLQDLSSGRREHVTDVGAVGLQLIRALATTPASDGRAGQHALLKRGGRRGRLDPELVDEHPPAREELT